MDQQAQSKLNEMAERLDLAVKAAKIGVWDMDLNSPEIRWTERQFEIFGIDPNTHPLTYEVFFQTIHPDDRDAVTAEYANSLKENRDFYAVFRIVKSGQIRWVQANGRTYYGPDGKPQRMIGTNMDITETKLAMDERQQNIERLTQERGIRERFVHALTHDLRTPLTAVKMLGQMLTRKASDEKSRQRAGLIVSNVNRMDDMISDLLDAGRLHAGLEICIHPKECDLREVVLESVDGLILAHGPRFTVECPKEVRGFWDPKGVKRIIENLATNAVKYGSANAPISIACQNVEGGAKLRVQNSKNPECRTGKELDSIFELFHRSDCPSVMRKKGWGIGLTVVKGLAEAHGGSVTIENADQTVFTVILNSQTCPLPQ